jgi:phage terminase small subunit
MLQRQEAVLPEVAVGVLRNTKHELFALALAKGETATRAYAAAGFKGHRSNASRMIANDIIKARVRELQGAVAEQHIVTQAEALRELKKIAFARVGNAVKWGAKGVLFKESVDLDDATMAAIAEVSESAEGALKIKFHGKPEAIDKIGKILGWYDQEAVKQQTQINITISRAEREGRL